MTRARKIRNSKPVKKHSFKRLKSKRAQATRRIQLKNRASGRRYIELACRKLLGSAVNRIKFIDVGAMNFVYEATTPKGKIYFKQALQKAKNVGKIGHDLASVSPLRIETESEFISKLYGKLPAGIHLPKILKYDKVNNILVMSDVSKGRGQLLQNVLLKGEFSRKTAFHIGQFLGTMHRTSYNKNYIIRNSKRNDMENWQRFLNMRTQGIKVENREAQIELKKLYRDALGKYTYSMLIYMDCCPKNTFQCRNNEAAFIDFELASAMGDPAYDVGFALGHYFLFSILNNTPKSSTAAMNTMVNAYLREIKGLPIPGMERRMIKYAAAIPLYRTTGSSPAPFIPKGKIRELREKGIKILTSNCTKIREVAKILK